MIQDKFDFGFAVDWMRKDVSCDTLIQRMNGPEGKIQFGTITKGDWSDHSDKWTPETKK